MGVYDGVELHSLHWDNFSPEMLAAHQAVMEAFDVPLRYHRRTVAHDHWLTEVMRSSTADVVGFIEPDLIPLAPDVVPHALAYVRATGSFVGPAQVANHIHPAAHVYAAPSFFFIDRSCYRALGSPSFVANLAVDTGEALSRAAEAQGVRYRALYPTHWDREAGDGAWSLGNYGWYGIGTVYAGQIYHLFEGRLQANIDLFVARCREVLDGTFTTDGMHDATDLAPPARSFAPPRPGGSRTRRLMARTAEGLAALSARPWRPWRER